MNLFWIERNNFRKNRLDLIVLMSSIWSRRKEVIEKSSRGNWPTRRFFRAWPDLERGKYDAREKAEDKVSADKLAEGVSAKKVEEEADAATLRKLQMTLIQWPRRRLRWNLLFLLLRKLKKLPRKKLKKKLWKDLLRTLKSRWRSCCCCHEGGWRGYCWFYS